MCCNQKTGSSNGHFGGACPRPLDFLLCTCILNQSVGTLLHSAFMKTYFTKFSNWPLGVRIGAINGDLKLIESGIAFAIFGLIALFQLTSGLATVDDFTSKYSPRSNQVLQMISECLFALVLGLISSRLFAGMDANHQPIVIKS